MKRLCKFPSFESRLFESLQGLFEHLKWDDCLWSVNSGCCAAHREPLDEGRAWQCFNRDSTVHAIKDKGCRENKRMRQ